MSSLPLLASSGDLIADRRYTIARDLAARGDLAEAAEVLAQALERTPSFGAGWFVLGEVRQQLGEGEAAAQAFRRVLALDPEDPHGAGLHLARLGAGPHPMSSAYVRTLFDQYASAYEHSLVERLGYRAPALVRAAVEAAQASRRLPVRFTRMLDLGCGTGLAAQAFADCCATMVGFDLSPAMLEQARGCATMVGFDLSPAMLEQARRKHLYASLATADLVEALEREAAQADLIIAADAFAYLADLHLVCRAARRVLTRGGLFAFTTETHDGEGVVLGEKLRYAHPAEHVRDALEGAGLAAISIERASARTEAGVAVAGLVVVATGAEPA